MMMISVGRWKTSSAAISIFSKRFEEEEEKEDEEHAIIETEVAVEAMMTKTTMRSVRSSVGDDVFYYMWRGV